MQQEFYFHCFSHNGLHGLLIMRFAVVDLQIPNAVYGIEYLKDRPYRSLPEALQEPILGSALLCT